MVVRNHPMSPKDTTKLGAAIRRHREAAGLTQLALANQIGVPASTIFRLEKGEFGRPDPNKLARLAEALGIEAEELYALAPYPELPEMAPYLRAKYGMSAEAVAEAEAFFAELKKRDRKGGQHGNRRR
jgi:transcriptional regulator with XRE-family HTH domain